jgi:hypothetical protein
MRDKPRVVSRAHDRKVLIGLHEGQILLTAAPMTAHHAKLSPRAARGQHQTHAWTRNVPGAFLYRLRNLAERFFSRSGS